MRRGHRTVTIIVLVLASAACGGPSATALSPAASASAQAGAALAALIEDVAGADGRVFGVLDDRGESMGPIEIIEVPETGGFAGTYFTWREDPGVFDVHLATSTDLLTWTWQSTLVQEASQPTILAAQDGGYVVAWETTRLAGDPSPPAFAYYSTWKALLRAEPSKMFEATLSLSPCCEGTPNLYSASSVAADVGIHFYDDYIRDRQARGTMTWTAWSVTEQPKLDEALISLGVDGHIGDRDAIRYEGFEYLMLEGQLRLDDNGAWRMFLVNDLTGTATPLDIRSPGGKASMSNPSLELVELDGRSTLVVNVFVHEGTDEESGGLIYYHFLDGE